MEYNKVSKKKWEEIILKSDDACFYHSPLWAKILEKTYGFRDSTQFFEVNGKEILVPMMKRRQFGFNFLSSMPFGYGGFFSESSINSDDIKSLINEIIGGRNLIFNFKLSNFSNLPLDFGNSSIIEIKDSWDNSHILPVAKDFGYIWTNKFKKKTRGAIRKAVNNKLKIRKGDSLDDFKVFYDIYIKASQKWGYENPEYPCDLYKNMYKYGSKYVNLYLATKDDETIAGFITFNFGKSVIPWASVFLNEYGTFNPTSLLYCHIIKKACNDGFKYVDFGESGNLNRVKKFKESFGAEIVKINRFRAFSMMGRFALNFHEIATSIRAK